ncbi:MAG: ABC transporter permease subunit [Acetivibrio sp.]
MNRTLFKKEWKSNYKILLLFMAVLTMYAWMIISMFDPKLGESLEEMAASMPQLFAAFGMMEAGTTLLEFISNYLYGFLLIAFPVVYIIILSNKLMSRYIDRGSMAYLLATPNKRSKIAITQAVVLILHLFLLSGYVCILCILTGESMFPGELEISKFITVNIGLYGLLFFLSGICFFSSCVWKEARISYGVSSGCMIAFILIQMISQVGDKFEKLKYLTPLTLFNTKGLMAGEKDAVLAVITLYIAGMLFYGAGVYIFDKRDLAL